MKSLMIATFLLCGILSAFNVSGESVLWGERGADDHIVAREVIQRPVPWFGATTVVVNYPKDPKIIHQLTAIKVIDLGGIANAATAEIVKGGPKKFSATIKITSQKHRSINMVIEFYSAILK